MSSYDYVSNTYNAVFKNIVEDKYGMYDILKIKKLLCGYYEYCEAIERNSPNDILEAIKNDYGVWI